MRTEKAPLIEKNLPQDKDLPLIRAWFEILHLKQVFRKGWLERDIPEDRCESVAEHSFGNAFLCLLLVDNLPKLDKEKVLRLALIHDLGEVYAGDLTPQDGVSKVEKYQREKIAVEKIIGSIPSCGALLDDWHEYENQTSPEARFVKDIDRLEFALQACSYQHQKLINAEDLMLKVSRELNETTVLAPFRSLFSSSETGP
jgi:putative hydrolase of HD superfamily